MRGGVIGRPGATERRNGVRTALVLMNTFTILYFDFSP
jgi:hypothetical protein